MNECQSHTKYFQNNIFETQEGNSIYLTNSAPTLFFFAIKTTSRDVVRSSLGLTCARQLMQN